MVVSATLSAMPEMSLRAVSPSTLLAMNCRISKTPESSASCAEVPAAMGVEATSTSTRSYPASARWSTPFT